MLPLTPSTRTPRPRKAALLGLATALFLGHASAADDSLPAPLKALEKQGVVIIGRMPSASGLPAWAATSGRQSTAVYLTPDGRHAILGILLDADGKSVDDAALAKVVGKPLSDTAWKQLEGSTWLQDGQASAPRIIYVFTDPNCPYCNKFWNDARPWVDSGKVQLRHVLIGVLAPSSLGKAAALLADKNPALALASHERARSAANLKSLVEAHRGAMDGGSLKPLDPIPPAIQSKLENNLRLMAGMGLSATPSVAWRDANGELHTHAGVPDDLLVQILGPR